jgi:hypothetical protein
MFTTVSERVARIIRWGFTLGWLVLIGSLFYDPISTQWTAPGQIFGAASDCFQFQGSCRPSAAYPMGARIFWGMVLPLVILTLLIFGHEAWRRICPLSFLSQIPRALGWQQRRVVQEDSWLGRHALSFQFGLLFMGLNIRLLLVNSDRLLLGIFLVLTILSAITVGFLYDGKTWCNYFCPMAPVQIIYSEPSGLLGSKAHTAPPQSITQSMCRTIDANGREKSACVACNVGCIDIDAEGSYWDKIRQPDRKLLYYGYVGLVIGFYAYFGLYSGNWNLLGGGVWNETNQAATLLSPGFFIAGQALAVPKLLAVPLTLTVASGTTYAAGLLIERRCKQRDRSARQPLGAEQVQSRIFASAVFLAFNLLFFWGVRPTLGYFPLAVQNLMSWGAVVASSLWLVKTWNRSAQRYARERDANLLRRQLNKLDIDFSQFLEGRSLDELKPDELYTLAKFLPNFTQDYQLQIYRGILQESLEKRSVTAANSFKAFQTLRQKFKISDQAHQDILTELQALIQQLNPDSTVLRQDSRPDGQMGHTTVVRPNRPPNRR